MALSYPIVDTGQTLYFNNQYAIPKPAPGQIFSGQDAQYAGYQPSYRDNGDGTVTDLVTGLMWQKSVSSEVSFDQAKSGAASFALGGYSDWRLPTVKELYSLIQFSGDLHDTESASTPYIDTRYFDFVYGNQASGKRLIDAQYWSSTQYVGKTYVASPGIGSDTAFGVNFADGRIKGYPTSVSPNDTHFVRYVRGNTAYGVNKFTDNGNGTVSDRATGLMWQTGDSGEGMNWQDALAYAEGSTYAGYSDWRLPNIKELQSILDYTKAPDATNPANKGPALASVFTPTALSTAGIIDYPWYWSGTTLEADGLGSEATYAAVGVAWGYTSGQLVDVHGAGAQRSDPKSGNPASYPFGRGPQNDLVRILNYVKLVRDDTSTSSAAGASAQLGLLGQNADFAGQLASV